MADDWRGWMGNSRDGVYRETGIINEIPDTGLPVKWRVPIYSGYAGPAAASGRVFIFDYQQISGDAFNNPGRKSKIEWAGAVSGTRRRIRKNPVDPLLRMPLQRFLSERTSLHTNRR